MQKLKNYSYPSFLKNVTTKEHLYVKKKVFLHKFEYILHKHIWETFMYTFEYI